jgi:[acyl-carrier-protein] S-malonyltransferase
MNGKMAYIFPGQGSQFVGMGKDIYDSSVKARDIFEQANQILNFRITDLMFNGPEEEQRKTIVAQLSIFLHSFVLSQISKNFTPDVVAGHSLGEISALAAAEIISFEDALILVKSRGHAMDKACHNNPSTMAAILGIDTQVIEEVCSSVDELVMPVNYNCPGQVVISGTIKGIEKACEKLRELRAKKIVPLSVAGGFHTPLMNSARVELATVIEKIHFRSGIAPICQNKTSKITSDIGEIKLNLLEHVTSPVLWQQSIKTMAEFGVRTFIECSRTQMLQNLVKKVLPDNVECYNI